MAGHNEQNNPIDKKENPHEGHRERVRESFRTAESLDSFQPHQVLEFLLFYTNPRKDTNVIAHKLIQRFGSLKHVLEAPYHELIQVEGVGDISATLIMFVMKLARRYLTEQSEEKIRLDSTAVLHAYAISLFLGSNEERAYLLCLDNAARLIHNYHISRGTKYSINMDGRTLLETAFRYNATKVVLVHNHPNGLAAPSKEDIATTQAAAKLFHSVEITLLDHLIVADGECFSMANSPRWGWIFLPNVTPLQKAADPT